MLYRLSYTPPSNHGVRKRNVVAGLARVQNSFNALKSGDSSNRTLAQKNLKASRETGRFGLFVNPYRWRIFLFDDFGDNTRTDRSAAFANRESDTIIHRNWLLQFN